MSPYVYQDSVGLARYLGVAFGEAGIDVSRPHECASLAFRVIPGHGNRALLWDSNDARFCPGYRANSPYWVQQVVKPSDAVAFLSSLSSISY